MSTKLTTRKELASETGLSVDNIRRNEEQLGLDKCKKSLNKRAVFYTLTEAMSALQARGWISK